MTRFSKGNPSKPKLKTDLKQIQAANEELIVQQTEIIKGHNNLVEFMNNSIKQLQRTIDEVSGVLSAVCKEIGVEKVTATFRRMQVDMAIEKAKEYDVELNKGLEAGTFVKQDVVTEGSLIVSTVTDANGNTVEPNRVHARFGAYLKETQEQFLGKAVGYKAPGPNGNTIEILEIYGDAVAPVVQDLPQE